MSIFTPSVITLCGETGAALLVPGALLLGGEVSSSPVDEISRKLQPENRINLGSETELGRVFSTCSKPYSLLEVVNAYLKEPLSAEELSFIVRNRNKFIFELRVGDRRDYFKSRYAAVDNWSGDDVVDFETSPEAFEKQPYKFHLWFHGEGGTIQLTDTHSGVNGYGGLRGLTVTEVNQAPVNPLLP
ncbi:TPA: hypothetical protein M2Q89_003802 [Escherichia coli]|nr:hypothetical protein [Escherichia coli]